MRRIRNNVNQFLAVLSLTTLGILINLGSTTVFSQLKSQFFDNNKPAINATYINEEFLQSLDGPMYIVIKESIESNLFGYSMRKSAENLMRLGIDVTSQEGRDLIYLAHTDRIRLLYPFLNILTGYIFGDFSFLVLNIIAYAGLVFLFIRVFGGVTSQSFLFLILLAGSTVPIYIFSAMPEEFIYLMMTLYLYFFYSIFVESHQLTENRRRQLNIIMLSLLIALSLMKPIFVITLFVQLCGLLYCKKNLKKQLIIHTCISVISGLVWIFTKVNTKSALDIALDSNPIRALLFSAASRQDNYSYDDELNIAALPLKNFISTIPSEINAQIIRLENVSIVILLFIFFILWKHGTIKMHIFYLSILTGVTLTQAKGGGLGTNFRVLNIFLLIGLLLSGKLYIAAIQAKDSSKMTPIKKDIQRLINHKLDKLRTKD